MKLTTLTISENQGLARPSEPITIGIPFAAGACDALDRIQLRHPSIGALALQRKLTGRWPDGSVKWALIDFQVALKANETLTIDVCIEDQSTQSSIATGIAIEEVEQAFIIDTGAAKFTLNKHKFTIIDQVTLSGHSVFNEAQGRLYVLNTPDDSHAYGTEITRIETAGGPQKLTVNTYGQVIDNQATDAKTGEALVRFQSAATFYANSATVELDITLHNPRAAKHKDNMWDLGDPGSIFFKALGLEFHLSNAEKPAWRADGGDAWHQMNAAKFSLYQDSSGGENWDCNTHKNHCGKVPLTFRGYQVTEDEVKISEGLRASPFIATSAVTAHIHRFWQNFPKGLQLQNGVLRLELFPEAFADNYELQGGEKKTHTISLDFSGRANALDAVEHPAGVTLPLDYYSQCRAMQHLSATFEESPMHRLIATGLEDPEGNYFRKRERIDEYGWRNFGDIFADHECLYLKDNEPLFISHYNNQYDSLYGFLRQFIITADRRWFELANDLAIHTKDIDIYNTIRDRCEYNGGLFWHTGHYLDAHTCSHRSYSKVHYDPSNPERMGGGPGSEHCYSTGLLYHHYLTGCEASKESVLKLAHWITHYYEGSGTLLDRIQRFKAIDLPNLKKTLSGDKVLPHRYPLDRGVGNYINSLIDAFYLTDKRAYIDQIEQIIGDTVHPEDDIGKRRLEDVETTWFYTIFFQAIIRYLGLKEELAERDMPYDYARATLLAYARWMVAHEKPYLSQPEILDYPNDTWAAQEIRKANILFYAALYSSVDKRAFLDKASFFYDYVVTTLTASDTCSFSRILAILMQNHGPDLNLFEARIAAADSAAAATHQPQKIERIHYLSTMGILKKAVVDCVKLLIRLNPKKELRWLSLRSSAVERLLQRAKLTWLTQVND